MQPRGGRLACSLHVPASDEAENTKRLVRAAQNPNVHMLGHLTGRLLLEREAYAVNQQAVIDAALACPGECIFIELGRANAA